MFEGLMEFFETYGSFFMLGIIVLGFILLKRLLANRRFENIKNVFEEPEPIARATAD